MDALIKQLVDKLGLSEDTARKAVMLMADFLKTKLPDPLFTDLELVLKMPEVEEDEARELGLFKFP
jgi:hypothetical protein